MCSSIIGSIIIVGGVCAFCFYLSHSHGPLTWYVKLRVVHAPGMTGTFSLPPRISYPGMHHGTCVAHVLLCMSGSLTRGVGENVSGIPGAWATCDFTKCGVTMLICLNVVRKTCYAVMTLASCWKWTWYTGRDDFYSDITSERIYTDIERCKSVDGTIVFVIRDFLKHIYKGINHGYLAI